MSFDRWVIIRILITSTWCQFSLRRSIIRIICIVIIQNRFAFNFIIYVFHLLFGHFWNWVWAILYFLNFKLNSWNLSLAKQNLGLKVFYWVNILLSIFLWITIILSLWWNLRHIILTRWNNFWNRILKFVHWV